MTISTIAPPTVKRFKQLDSLRGLAALCVFISHCFLMFDPHARWVSLLRMSPLGILINGRAAVMFFFVLSGFVLSLPFINSDRPLKLIEFYVKRIFRIYPAYLLAIVIAIALKSLIVDKNAITGYSDWIRSFWGWHWDSMHYKEIIRTFLLIGPNFNADLIDPVIWSLVVEMKMSLLMPFFIIIASRSNLLFNLLFFGLILALIYNHQNGFLGVFYIGILCAKYKDEMAARIRSLNIFLVLALLICALFFYNISYEFYKPYGDRSSPFAYFWRDYVNAIGSALVLLIAVARKRVGDVLQIPVFNFMGDVSYSFYLLHMPFLIACCALFSNRVNNSAVFIIISALAITTVISFLAYKAVEIPFQRMAKGLVDKYRLLRALNMR